MNAALRAADARWEVVRAAESWRRIGAIDEAARARIGELYRDDRQRTRPAFRFLFFVFTVLGGEAVWGFVAILFGLVRQPGQLAHAGVLLALAALAALGAEAAIEKLRLRRFGVEEGLVALALGFGTAATFLLADRAGLGSRASLGAVGLALAFGAGAAAWRWGTPLCGALGTGGLLAAAFAAPGARWLWLGIGIGAVVLARRFADDDAVAAAHRRRLEEAAIVGWLATYAAVHAEGVRHGWFGFGGPSAPPADGTAALALAWTAMLALPAVLLVVGLRRRERPALALGALLGFVSCGGAADALDLRPVWLVLLGAGGALLLLALLVRRSLASAPGRIRRGFTDRPLDEAGERGGLEIAAALAVFTPEARREPTPEGFQGGGGELGGGGASARY